MLPLFHPVPLVISFYTLDTPYEKDVQNLVNSCKKFDVDMHIEGIPDRGSWELNCAYKPFFIREKLQAFERPIFWVDADAVFLQKPDFEMFLTEDFSVVQLSDQVEPCYRVRAGSIFVNTTVEGWNILDAWCQEAERLIKEKGAPIKFLDQMSLYQVLCQNQTAHIGEMPLSYCKVYDYDSEYIDQSKVVIEHHQASRRHRFFFLEREKNKASQFSASGN
jgi:hypothetical protein